MESPKAYLIQDVARQDHIKLGPRVRLCPVQQISAHLTTGAQVPAVRLRSIESL